MKDGSQSARRDSLSGVRSQFERWRRSRRLGTRIPESLWLAAVEAGREHGVSKTAQALGLDYYCLKKRVASVAASSVAAVKCSGVEPPSAGGFLEIPPVCAPSSSPECVLEIEDGHGSRLRVEVRGTAPSELAKLARAFLGALQ